MQVRRVNGTRKEEGTVPRGGAAGGAAAPSPWVARFAPLVPAGGAVLDLACGGGRHTRLFLNLGHPVTAVDRDVGRLADLRGEPALTVAAADLENGRPWPLGDTRFAAVVITNYLHRPLFPAVLRAIAPGGLLIYETFAAGNEALGRPRNPDFLLRRGELLGVARAGGLDVVAFEDLRVNAPRPSVVQRLCARRPAGGSDGAPPP
jgi:SAM-dependent methyltransferase